jgi:hypothetical protein
MSKRRRGREGSLFQQQPAKSTSVDEVADEIFGAIAQAESVFIRAEPINIFSIQADPAQPRRAVPFAVRQQLTDVSSIGEVFQIWQELVGEERGEPFDLAAWFQTAETAADQPDDTLPDATGGYQPRALEASLLKVVDLAASIYRDGLTNPITVVRTPDGYQLETGERRWLAYQLLNDLSEPDDEQWLKIPARIVESISVWRQAGENNARDNLNAIAKSRQFAILLMDLLRSEKQTQFQPYAAFDFEQSYYAQVAELSPPYGTSDRLLNAMGVTHKSAITRYRSLLKLPPDVWVVADDFSWGLADLYKMTTLSDEEAQQFSCALARKYGHKVAWCNDSEDITSKPKSEPPVYMTGKRLAKPDERDRIKLLSDLGEGVAHADKKTKKMLLAEIGAHEEWLAGLKQKLAQ